jgi:hypothetical protein
MEICRQIGEHSKNNGTPLSRAKCAALSLSGFILLNRLWRTKVGTFEARIISSIMASRRPFQPLPALGPYMGRTCRSHVKGMGHLTSSSTGRRTRQRGTGWRSRQGTWRHVAAMTTDEINGAVTEWAKFKVRDVERGRLIENMVKDHKIPKHTAHAFMVRPTLEGHCPRCTMVHDPTHCRFTEEECVVLHLRGPPAVFRPCNYSFCKTLPSHTKRYCQKLNLRCLECLYRGHAVEDLVCDKRISTYSRSLRRCAGSR